MARVRLPLFGYRNAAHASSDNQFGIFGCLFKPGEFVKKRLAANSLSNVVTLFLKLGITFIMTPVLIRNLGQYDYGLWEMIGAVLGYMGMLDLGIRPTVIRFAAGSIAKKDEDSLREIYTTAWFYLAGVGLLIAVFLVCWGSFFPHTFAEDSTSTQRYTLLMLILAGRILIVFPAYTAQGFMAAYQEYYLINSVTIFNSIVGSILVWNLISPENALVLIAGINSVGLSSKYIFYCIYLYRKKPFLKPRLQRFSVARLREMFRFSFKTLIQGLSTRMQNATDTIVIGSILGPASVPFYSIPANLVNYIRMIVQSITIVFMPYFSSLHATGEKEKTVRVYIIVSKFTISIALIFAIGAIGLGKAFLTLWVGPDLAKNAGPIIAILVAFTVMPLTNPFESRFLTACDRHGVYAKWEPVVALTNLGLSLVLIKSWGIIGVAIGSLIPAVLIRPYYLWFCCRELGISVTHFAVRIWLPLVPPALAMSALMVFANYRYVIDSYGTLLIVASAASIVFFAVGYFSVLRPSDRVQIRLMLSRSKAS